MGYVSRKDRALVNTRLYLPEEWAADRARRKAAGVPKHVRFQTRHQQALEMLDEQAHLLPHAWIAGDDEMGRNTLFRRDLNERGEQYLLAVPCNTLIRDLEAAPPAYRGRGAVPKRLFERVDQWPDTLPDDAWTRIPVRDAEKGPLEVEVVACRVRCKINQRTMKYDETLVIVRSLNEEGVTKYDYYLSNASQQVFFEEVLRGTVAAAPIAKDQQPLGLRIGLATVFLPPQGDAVATQLARVVAGIQVDMSVSARLVVNAVRDQLAPARTGKIVVERLHGLFGKGRTRTVKITELLLLFRVDADHRIARLPVLPPQSGNVLELGIAVGMLAHGFLLSRRAASHVQFPQQTANRAATDRRTQLPQPPRQLPQREVGLQHVGPHRVAGRELSQQLPQVVLQLRMGAASWLPPPLFFGRDRPPDRVPPPILRALLESSCDRNAARAQCTRGHRAPAWPPPPPHNAAGLSLPASRNSVSFSVPHPQNKRSRHPPESTSDAASITQLHANREVIVDQILTGENRRTLQGVIRYYENHRSSMRYDEYLAAGYPIGSGVVEGACRHLVKDRMERTGMRWSLPGARAILHLRSVYLNEDWPNFVKYRTEAEQAALYGQLAA